MKFPTLLTSMLTLSSSALFALNPGDIAIIGYNTSGSPDSFTIVTLDELPAGTAFYVNDNEVATAGGSAFVDLNEGEASFTVKTGQTIAAGTVITLPWGAAAVSTTTYDFTATTGAGLGASGDELHIYEAASLTATSASTFIVSAKIGTSAGLIPAGLTAGTTFISPTTTPGSRYKIAGATYTGTSTELLTAIGNVGTNWEAVAPVNTSDWTFSVGGAPPTNTLTLSVSPASFSESATNPAATGTVTRSEVTASDLEVTLTSPDTTEVTVPTTVTILANQASANFDVTAMDDSIPDGDQIVNLTASAASSTAGNFNVTVQDDGDTLPPPVLSAGDIAFIGFNADGNDDMAFVALDTIPAGTTIYFTDNEWNGTAFADTAEAIWSWSTATDVSPGTVITIGEINSTALTTNIGAAAFGTAPNKGVANSNEAILAYLGTDETSPTSFLAAIGNDTLASTGNDLTGTGLVEGTSALFITGDEDVMAYNGARNTQPTFADYAALINSATNWITEGGSGDQHNNASAPDTPFDATAFTLGVPASATVEIAATVSAAEGNSGSTPLSFAVTRSLDSTAFSVDYAVTGGTATSGDDFTPLASGTLTFPAYSGPLSQDITVDVLGDTTIESNETIVITLSNLVQTTGTTALGNAIGTGTIANDDTVPVTYPGDNKLTLAHKATIGDRSPGVRLSGAEIVAYDPASKRAFLSSGSGIEVIDMTNPAAPVYIGNISLVALGLPSDDISSVAVRGGVLAAAAISSPKTAAGRVAFIDAATAFPVPPASLLGSATVGAVPDHLTFTPDGTKVLTADEGELVADPSGDTTPGTVSIIDVSGGFASPTVSTAGFASFNASAAALKAAGVRIFAGGTPEFDFEPEYLAVSPDSSKAMVSLQEANAVAVLDIATATFTSVVPLGEKDFSTLRADFSDKDGAGGSKLINPTTGNPVFGLYMPDQIASFQSGGQTYYITANEGDDRDDFLTGGEGARLADLNLDDTAFPTEATLLLDGKLGRLTVSNTTGLDGDTDPADGDIDRVLAFGGRSFSILDSTGAIVYDSGDMIEMIVASQFPARFDDGRSDNKGPEPEGITVATVGNSTFAFVGLERSNMVLVFDVSNPLSAQYVGAMEHAGDVGPEGLHFVSAADSPNGKALMLVANETSKTLTAYEINTTTDFTLQLLHLADAEAGLLASTTAPNLAALVDAFDGTYPNTLILAGGDNYIPGPFAAAGTDSTVSATHTKGNNPFAADIEIHNRLGVEASTIGNHEFDFGTGAFSDAIGDTNFPYLSSNLDFSGDSGISGRYLETVGTGLEEASSVKNKIVPSCVVTKGTEKIGLVGVTTQILESISSTGNVEVKGFTGDGLETNDMALLASQVQPVINDLKSQGVDKIILMAHLQQIAFEQALAPLLTDVDIVLAAGSNTRLGDSNDVAVAFTGHAADFAGNYPIYTAGADGKPTVIVNTDNEFTYLGRLVADFDVDGELIVPNLTAKIVENGAYAATAANVADAWGVAEVDLPTTAFAAGTKGALVKQITDAVQNVITVKDGDVRGYTDVYLEGERNFVRNQETNLGDISADSMIFVGKTALPSAPHVAALKNGGGIRAAIGTVNYYGEKLPPLANPAAGKPEGAISLLDIENSMRFNNGLMICDTTPAGLKAILEHGVANAGTGNGRFPQIGGIRFSYDPAAAAGSRIQSIVLIDENDHITGRVVSGGVVRPDAPATISIVTLNFLAQGGDSYPFKANADNFRFLLNDGTLSAPVDEALSFTTGVPSNILGEQLAMANYVQDRYAAPATAYDIAETVPALDTRIQDTDVRTDSVLDGPATFDAWLAENGFTSGGINTDTDGDGSKDLVEYFFNRSTNSGSDNGNLPVVSSANGDKLITFTTNNTVANVSGTLECSLDLGVGDPWTAAVLNVDYEVVSNVVSGSETTTTIKLLGAATAKFFRHSVTQN